jgi:predicted ATPase
MIGEKRFLRSIQLRNLLSFGPDTPELELKSLNVLIGPNGSGKSNLIDAISLLQAAPRDLWEPIRMGGGIAEWLWKGSRTDHGEITTTVSYPTSGRYRPDRLTLRHDLSLDIESQRPELVSETIKREDESEVFSRHPDGTGVLRKLTTRPGGGREQRGFELKDLATNQSIVSQLKDPQRHPELTFLGKAYEKIKLYREWRLGRNSPPRAPQSTDLASDFLQEDAANLALVLNDLEVRGLKHIIVEKLKSADESITGFTTRVLGGTIQLTLHHEGLREAVAATRLSDGTIRYLCLLSILCHPEPPPLVCLEEPELGLHPDLIVELADLLIDASHRMQLIVTTHSDILVDALTSIPEAVIVCEKENGSTRMKRLNGEELLAWLKEYGLGQLWRRGQIGGNRW